MGVSMLPGVKEVRLCLTLVYEDDEVAHIQSPTLVKNLRGGTVFTNHAVLKAIRIAVGFIWQTFRKLKVNGVYREVTKMEPPEPFSLN